ncbi:YslB family protein [Bacillus niameyensis]|uniref:YslB family protein n=1 Tax=Bacillus niameyensis TaxID=1522308 RepID=UPI000784698E|nr:YslB family protein [Bacillus niameyensis]
MKDTLNQNLDQESKNQLTISTFAYELLRDILIPDLLGKDTEEISYWAGKNLARKFPLLSTDEIVSFFLEAAWGNLELIEESKQEMKFELTGGIIERRIEMQQDPSFRLEAGFIAEQIQSKKNFTSEAYDEILKKKNKVLITVRWDKKDPIHG